MKMPPITVNLSALTRTAPRRHCCTSTSALCAKCSVMVMERHDPSLTANARYEEDEPLGLPVYNCECDDGDDDEEDEYEDDEDMVEEEMVENAYDDGSAPLELPQWPVKRRSAPAKRLAANAYDDGDCLGLPTWE